MLPKINGELSLRLRNCYDNENNVEWFHQKNTGKLISSVGFCLAANNPSKIILERCNHHDATNSSFSSPSRPSIYEWERSGGHLRHQFTKLCLDNPFSDVITLTECRGGAPSQLFSFSIEIENL